MIFNILNTHALVSIHRAYYVLTLYLFVLSADNLNMCNQSVGHPDLGPNCLTLIVFLKEFFEKVDSEKNKKCHSPVTNAPKGIGLA